MAGKRKLRAGTAFVERLRRENPKEFNRWQFIAVVSKMALSGNFAVLRGVDPALEQWGRKFAHLIETQKRMGEDISLTLYLGSLGFDIPLFSEKRWRHLARIVGVNPDGLTHEEIYSWASAWIDREELY